MRTDTVVKGKTLLTTDYLATALYRKCVGLLGRLWAGLAMAINRRYVYYSQVDAKAKCPACGHRQEHKIVWSGTYQKLIHQCSFCAAHWGESPMAKAEHWMIQQPQMSDAELEAQALPKPPWSGAQREPLRVEIKKSA